ncbi:hypothetical protein J7E29_09950 [Streptomyces sp. ISL-90]|nr:hypothetical protein [Streptomyces sp. ISL-90]
MREAHEGGQPVMRAMFHEFPADPVAWTLADQFMFGSDLLVAPVAHGGLTARRVYLPAGATWTNLATGTTHDGGQYLDVDAPLDVIPVFARDGRLPHLVGAI